MTSGYTIIINDLLEDENLNIQEQSLLVALISYHSKEKGYAYPSYKQLKLRSKLKDNRTLIKTIDSLIGKGYIAKQTLKGIGVKYFITKCNTTSSEELHEVENYTKCKDAISPSGELRQMENCTECKDVLPLSGELHENVVDSYTTTNTNKRTSTIKDDFYEIIILYPGKKIKAVRDKKLPKLVKQYGKEQMIRCVKRYADECKGKDKQYILNESTFWNGRYIDYLDSIVDENPVLQKKRKRCT